LGLKPSLFLQINTVVTRSSVAFGSKNGNFSREDVDTDRFSLKRNVKMWKAFPDDLFIRKNKFRHVKPDK